MGRRLTKQQKRILDTRRDEQLKNQEIQDDHYRGRVISQHGAHLTLEDSEGILYKAGVRQSLGSIVCGDYVYYTLEQNEPVVTTRLPRENIFSRIGYGGKERILAANIDHVFIVLAPKPEPSPSLLDRYLIATGYLNLNTHILINKKDLIDTDTDLSFLHDYKALNIPIHYTSVKDRDSLAQLNTLLERQTSIFVGQSGVGKSSLTNQLIPELELQTQKINASTGLGNHTTSSTTLYHLPSPDSFIIDSPGVRSFNIDHLPIQAINTGFSEIYPLTFQCKFSNCRHLQDPHCAVKIAVENREISKRRVESYLQILSEIK